MRFAKLDVVLYPRTRTEDELNLFLNGESTGAAAAFTESVALWVVHSLEP